MCEGEKTSDVFFRGVLLYKPGALTTCQKCRAELRFESRTGFKRLDLYPIHGNRKMPGSPSMTIPLTNALGVTSGKQHAITRAKHTFLLMTARERYQLSTLTEEEKRQWMEHLDLILNHFPVDNRTYEFHVSISPTTHSDKLQLTGQYLLKVTEAELRLFSASGNIQSKFWTPLGCIRSATYCLLPPSATPSQRGRPSRKHLLIIYTEGSSPNGEGGFAFFTDSAKDIATTIIQRKEMRLQARSANTKPSPTDTNPPTTSQSANTKPSPTDTNPPTTSQSANTKPSPTDTNPPTTSRHQKLQSIKSDPVSPSSEEDHSISSSSEGEVRLRERGEQSSLRKCVRGSSRRIPISHQLEKAKSQLKLQLDEGAEQQQKVAMPLFTPDEPTHIRLDELVIQQQQFKEWKREWEKERAMRDVAAKRRTSPGGVLSPTSSAQKKWVLGSRWSTISTPTPDRESRPFSDMSSQDGDYVTILPRYRQGVEEEEEEEEADCEMSLGKLRGLQRQSKIDLYSPSDKLEKPEFVGIRPRTNAITAYDHSPLSSLSPTHQSRSPERRRGDEAKMMQCDGDSCWLQTRPPRLPATRRKSGSDPQLSTHEDYDLSASYLKILPPSLPTNTAPPPTKKTPKKPKPLPRTRKPASIPPCEGFTMTPQTLTVEYGSVPPNPHRSLKRGLDVGTLLSNQRSLSESNLFANLSKDSEDEYVDMSHYQRGWEQPQLYVNYNELNPECLAGYPNSECVAGYPNPECLAGYPVTLREGTLQRWKMRRQVSNSCGDIPTALLADKPQPLYENARCCTVLFQETEEVYGNGKHAMEHYLYGSTREDEEEEEEESYPSSSSKTKRGNVTAPCTYQDSGLGSTPSGSPLYGCQQRSFSMDDVRQAGSGAQWTDEDQLEMTERLPNPCQWQFPDCVKIVKGRRCHAPPLH